MAIQNKFELINVVLQSTLGAQDKCLLIELIARSDDDGYSWQSIQRLAQARGMKHEKNFKGADVYLPNLISKARKGRKMTYTLDVEAILALPQFETVIKYTSSSHAPADGGVDAPAGAEGTPAGGEEDPVVGGANS